MINGSPNHGPMGAAFHSVLINRVTRTHQGGKNMGARKYSSPPSPPLFCPLVLLIPTLNDR
jgi:hypothetical protein